MRDGGVSGVPEVLALVLTEGEGSNGLDGRRRGELGVERGGEGFWGVLFGVRTGESGSGISCGQ
jgi:hypothetical protein